METDRIIQGDCLGVLRSIPSDTVDLIVTSPPYNNWRNRRTQAGRSEYWKRTNIVYDECGDDDSDEQYEAKQVEVINELIRVLKPTGTLCYNHKDRIFNFEVRSPIQWISQTNAKIRQRVTWDRGGMQAYNPVRFYRVEEDIYILGKGTKGFKWNSSAAKYLSIWRIPPSKNVHGHNATFPDELVRRCIEGFTDEGDLVLDPYNGIGTTTRVARTMGRKYLGIELSESYIRTARELMGEGEESILDL